MSDTYKWINEKVLKFKVEAVKKCKVEDLPCYYSSGRCKSVNFETKKQTNIYIYIYTLLAICLYRCV